PKAGRVGEVHRLRRGVRRLVLGGLLLAAAVYGLWVFEIRRPARRADDPPQSLVIGPGWGVHEIGNELVRLGLGRHPAIFRLLVAVRGQSRHLRAGEYAFEGSLSLEQVLDKLVRGDVVHHWLVFPEGTDIEGMADIVTKEGIARAVFIAAAGDPSP